MADFNVNGNNTRFTIPINEASKLIFNQNTDYIHHFSIRSLGNANVSIRYDGEVAVLDAQGTLPINLTIVGYDGLYSPNRIGQIDIIADAEVDIILFNYY